MRAQWPRRIAIVLFALLFVGAVLSVSWPKHGIDENPPTNEDVSQTLFGEQGNDIAGYGLVMFLIGILLLVALLGGIFLAKEEGGK